VKHVICSKGGISWLAETPSRFELVVLFGSHLVGDSQLKVGHIGDTAQVLQLRIGQRQREALMSMLGVSGCDASRFGLSGSVLFPYCIRLRRIDVESSSTADWPQFSSAKLTS
jgi:hypothetical protein